jgi:hypothetical protein
MTSNQGTIPAITGAGAGKSRVNFSLYHMRTAIKLALLAKDIEEANKGKEFGAFFEELMSYVTATVIIAGTGLESYINELFLNMPLTQTEIFWKKMERKPTLKKYDEALKSRNYPILSTEKKASAETLIMVRNALVHFKPQWEDETRTHNEITRELRKEGVKTSPFMKGGSTFPQGFMSYDMAKWAVNTSLQFVDAFSVKANINNNLTQHLVGLSLE